MRLVSKELKRETQGKSAYELQTFELRIFLNVKTQMWVSKFMRLAFKVSKREAHQTRVRFMNAQVALTKQNASLIRPAFYSSIWESIHKSNASLRALRWLFNFKRSPTVKTLWVQQWQKPFYLRSGLPEEDHRPLGLRQWWCWMKKWFAFLFGPFPRSCSRWPTYFLELTYSTCLVITDWR